MISLYTPAKDRSEGVPSLLERFNTARRALAADYRLGRTHILE
jgi:hypothetical protein